MFLFRPDGFILGQTMVQNDGDFISVGYTGFIYINQLLIFLNFGKKLTATI